IAFMIYFYLLKEIGSVQTAAVTYVIPIVALTLDFFLRGHRIELMGVFGVSVILLALFFIRSAKPV
ncbi:MAG: hypothetical protein JWQ35_819, partial [Bacteriovoracaceae bacterium]|nr:hypothetical protein [Bacteriovoracaceae bacterium]